LQGFQRFPNIKINIKSSKENRKTILDNETGEKYHIYSSGDDIAGEIVLDLPEGTFDHNGISVELIGQIGI